MNKGSKAFGYEWMVKYTPQGLWIEGKGIYLWLAFFFTEIFAGVCFISLFLNLEAGLLVGWLGALLVGGFFHMLYLGKATRGWRILFKFSTSELSRGLWIIMFFGLIGFLQIVPLVAPGLPWAWNAPLLKVLMGIVSILVIIHGFTTMSVVKALPMWNSPMLIPLSLASGVWVGSQIVMMVLLALGSELASAEIWARWSLFFYMGTLLIYLWGGMHTTDTSRASIKRLLAGDCSVYFYTGAIALGIVIPLLITLAVWGRAPASLSGALLFLRFLSVFIGDAIMRYALMKAPYYAPLI